MLAVITQFLNSKFQTMAYVGEVLGMAELIEKDGEKFPSYYSHGEPLHLNMDTHTSLVYILKNGKVTRETKEHPFIATKEMVTETYPLRAIIYSKGIEDVNCSSQSQAIANGIKKNIAGKQSELREALNASHVFIDVKDTELDKTAVWKSQYSEDSRLKETDTLIAIDFEAHIEGDEQCFAGEPCQANDFVFSQPAESFCDKVEACGVGSNEDTVWLDGTGVTTYIISELIGKNVLLGGTDGRIRIKNSDYTFTSATGQVVFASTLKVGQKAFFLYK